MAHKKTSANIASVVQLLCDAALGRELTTAEPWLYGWCDEQYRRSDGAAIAYDHEQAIRLHPDAVGAFEDATQRLLKMPLVRKLYDGEEIWGLVASLVGSLPLEATSDKLATVVEERVSKLLNPGDSFVVLPVANVDPGPLPLEIGPLLLGRLGPAWMEKFSIRSGVREFERSSQTPWWVELIESEDLLDTSDSPVLLAYFSDAQLQRATHDAEECFQTLLDLALMLEPDLDGRSLHSLRGDSHRPGIRGLVIDRRALLGLAKTTPEIHRDLSAPTLNQSLLGQFVHYRGYGENPFPLADLLEAADRVDAARLLLTGSTVVHRRLRIAARWHAKAFWSSQRDEAVLALGIAFDAMLSESNPSPGRVLGERFALLSTTPDTRAEHYRLFMKEYYAARNAVAHGAKQSTIDGAFVRRMAVDVRRVFRAIFEFTHQRNVKSEDEYREHFERLKWGTLDVSQGPC